MMYISIPYKGVVFGILRWISKRIEIKDLYGNNLINISVDSSGIQNVAAPIGYVNDNISWWYSDNVINEHFYIVDFKTFRTAINGILLSMSVEHFHKVYVIDGSNDGTTWYPIKEACFPSKPESNLQYIHFDSFVKYRYYKISSNDIRHDGSYRLTLGPLDFYGKVLWDISFTCKHHYQGATNTLLSIICLLSY